MGALHATDTGLVLFGLFGLLGLPEVGHRVGSKSVAGQDLMVEAEVLC